MKKTSQGIFIRSVLQIGFRHKPNGFFDVLMKNHRVSKQFKVLHLRLAKGYFSTEQKIA